MTIAIEKILNITFTEYVESQKKRLYDYDLIGVHSKDGCIKKFSSKVPDEAEVVVNYQYRSSGAGSGIANIEFRYSQVGTALIPKEQ